MDPTPVKPAELEVLVVGLARNCEASLERDLMRMRKATALFKRTHFLVVESDSSDRTVAVLQGLSGRIPELRYITLGELRREHPKRTDRIAHCRNRYIEELESNPLYREVRYVIVSDLDGVSKDITPGALASCWAAGVPAWDVCTANQGDYYYDIWALRHPIWCRTDPWQEHDALQSILGERAAKEIAILNRMVHIDPSLPMIEVESAFGGLAIYRREALVGGRYAGLDETGREVCEHVQFHAQLRARGLRIFINPAMINAHRTEHSNRKSFVSTLRRTLGPMLRRRR